MSGIQGLGGVNGPKPERPVEARERDIPREENRPAASSDDIRISSNAQQAANVARLLAQSSGDEDVRAERVAAAKAALERDEHKDATVLAETARRIAQHL